MIFFLWWVLYSGMLVVLDVVCAEILQDGTFFTHHAITLTGLYAYTIIILPYYIIQYLLACLARHVEAKWL